MSSARRHAQQAAPLLVLLLTGCAASSARDDLEARLVQLEVQLGALERRIDEPAVVLERVEALEAVLAVPQSPDADLVARVAALEAQVGELLAERVRRPQASDPDRAAARADPARDPVTIPSAPPGTAGPVAVGKNTEVLSAGSGELLLVRTAGGLQRVQLLGIEAPERAEVYATQAEVRQRHVEAFGAQAITDDAAFEASRAHLEKLIQGPVVLTRPTEATASYVRVPLETGGELDVNAAMVRDGYALPRPDHPRAAEFEALAAEARAEKRGLFARP